MTTKRDGSLNRLFFFFKDCLFFLLSGPSLFFLLQGPSLFLSFQDRPRFSPSRTVPLSFFSGPSLFLPFQDRPRFSPSRTVPLSFQDRPSFSSSRTVPLFGVAFVTFWGDGAYYVVYNQTKEDYV